MKIGLKRGELEITNEVFSSIAGYSAAGCFGVRGMAVRGVSDGIVRLLKRDAPTRGVKTTENEDGSLSIELHIVVKYGVSLVAACRSIMDEVRYETERLTGVPVREVNVSVDSIMAE